MKPLVLISGLQDGGAERITVSFLTRLAQLGREATLCTVTDRHDGPLAVELRSVGATRIDLGARRLADPVSWWRYISCLRRQRFDIVHAHGQDACILVGVVRRFVRVPVIVSRHVLDEPEDNWRRRLRSRTALRALKRADAVVAVSNAAAVRLSELTGLASPTLQVIPNGIDVDRYANRDLWLRREEFRSRLGYRPEDRLLLVPAALRRGKGHESLLAAVPSLCRSVPRVNIVFAGGGELRDELELMARPFGRRVRFLGPRQDVPELLAAADLVVLPSRSEALPTVLMEASAAGRPIVATRVGGTVEVVEDGRTGLLVPPGDAVALADATTAILADPDRARRLAAAAAMRARRSFSIDTQIESTLALWAGISGAPS